MQPTGKPTFGRLKNEFSFISLYVFTGIALLVAVFLFIAPG